MRSICFFASYFKDNQLPYYIKVYLRELKKHFNNVVLLTHQDLPPSDIDFLNKRQIQLSVEKNEGYDFGMWYKAFQKYDVNAFDRVALVNDSAILFKSLDNFMSWVNSDSSDLQGMTFSESRGFHLQSYFIVINKKAIKPVEDYFKKQGIIPDLQEVIKTYEVGLSQFVLSQGLTISSYVDNNGYKGEFSPYYHLVDYHISKGIPLIKKKILFSSYRKDELFTLARMNFNISPSHYTNSIKASNKDILLDFDKLFQDVKGMSALPKVKYNTMRILIKWLRPLYKKLKND
jgi:lipopolysaccharide biosynthesis protein